eukprot:TRINITY_DN5594_c0_g1_i1.p1 TRINITY_DN5594_c0_g1~~TRINITY_DN5594_c0_g1_i1.p1  ORF type:complete len:177 (+),score=27.97 TRINITY_DN5594_c0_g1_i1:275-805(+)
MSMRRVGFSWRSVKGGCTTRVQKDTMLGEPVGSPPPPIHELRSQLRSQLQSFQGPLNSFQPRPFSIRYYDTFKPLERELVITFVRVIEKKARGSMMSTIGAAARRASQGVAQVPPSLSSLSSTPASWDVVSKQLEEMFELSPVDVARRLSVMEFDIFKLVRKHGPRSPKMPGISEA